MFLPDLERDGWRLLTSAPARKQDGFKTCTLATVAPGGLPDARTVVLRRVDEAARIVWFHTDRRAGKVAQLQANPHATLLFWDEHRQLQLRLTVETTLHTDDAEASEQWAKLWVGGRKTYLSERLPGSEQAEPYPGFPPALGENLPTEAESEAGRANFMAVACRVRSLEYLKLGRAGQIRARFTYGEGDERGMWLAP